MLTLLLAAPQDLPLGLLLTMLPGLFWWLHQRPTTTRVSLSLDIRPHVWLCYSRCCSKPILLSEPLLFSCLFNDCCTSLCLQRNQQWFQETVEEKNLFSDLFVSLCGVRNRWPGVLIFSSSLHESIPCCLFSLSIPAFLHFFVHAWNTSFANHTREKKSLHKASFIISVS